MRNFLRRYGTTLAFLLVLLLMAAVRSCFAQEFPEKPTGFVNDYAELLKPDERDSLERRLQGFRNATSNEISVAIFPALQGYPIEDFSIAVARKWGVGGKANKNGVLIAIFPNDRQMRIEVGYGLEAVIPDAFAADVIARILRPSFVAMDYYGGLRDAVSLLEQKAKGEINELPEPSAASTDLTADEYEMLFEILGTIVLLFLAMFWIASLIGGKSSGGSSASGSSYQSWSSRSGYSSGSSSSYSSGSSSGSSSGFSGFGGGDFGGGGASGSW